MLIQTVIFVSAKLHLKRLSYSFALTISLKFEKNVNAKL